MTTTTSPPIPTKEHAMTPELDTRRPSIRAFHDYDEGMCIVLALDPETIEPIHCRHRGEPTLLESPIGTVVWARICDYHARNL